MLCCEEAGSRPQKSVCCPIFPRVLSILTEYKPPRTWERVMRQKLSSRKTCQGQVILMVTFALIPMIAMLGLVTDLGYMYFIKESAQAAADAAAKAAIYRFNRTITGSTFSCASPYPWLCNTTPWSCPSGLTSATNPIESACLYAKDNGFYPTNSRQNVTIVSNITSTIPTAPGVSGAGWWITVRVTQTVPQLFSAIAGNRTGLVAARTTAVIQPGDGCVYALDPVAPASFYQNGTTSFQSACGIYVDSSDPTAMQGKGGGSLT